MSTDLPTVTNDEDWQDIPLGDACVVIGRLDSIAYGGQPCLLVSFADWSQLAIRAEEVTTVPRAWMREQVRIRCVRDEDGLVGKVMWKGYHAEGVPVPLTSNSSLSGNLTGSGEP